MPAAKKASLYDRDFFDWTQRVAARLRDGSVSQSDLKKVALEIRDMGKRDLREAKSRMRVLVIHLLKWEVQPEHRETWLSTINLQRMGLEQIFEQSPSIRQCVEESLGEICQAACEDLLKGRVSSAPYTFEQIVDDDWFPPIQ
jgi:hypothetical protein